MFTYYGRSNIIALLYFIIGFSASVFGALAGLGGGIIIKPVLDLLGQYDLATIGILSACTVFSMSCVSLFNFMKQGIRIKVRLSLLIAFSSIVGGVVGKVIFNSVIQHLKQHDLVTLIQAIIIAVLLIFIIVLMKYKFKAYQIDNQFVILAVGFILGVVAAFLGIGGGPFNVAILTLLFSMTTKESAINSILIIFFSQLSSISYTAASTGFGDFNLSMLPYIVIGGMFGGYIGSRLTQKLKANSIDKIFLLGIILIIFINVFNIVKYFL